MLLLLYIKWRRSSSSPTTFFFIYPLLGNQASSETLLRLTELVLTIKCFSFADNYYKQVNGEAMGTKMGHNYANLFVGYIELQFFNQYRGPKPELYRRHIDYRIGATSSIPERTSINL